MRNIYLAQTNFNVIDFKKLYSFFKQYQKLYIPIYIFKSYKRRLPNLLCFFFFKQHNLKRKKTIRTFSLWFSSISAICLLRNYKIKKNILCTIFVLFNSFFLC